MPSRTDLVVNIALGLVAVFVIIYLARFGWQMSTQLAINGPRRPSGYPDVYIQLAGIISGALVGVVVSLLLSSAVGGVRRLGQRR